MKFRIVLLAALAALVANAGAGGGLLFDGSGTYVTAGTAPSLGAATFTIECWFFRTGAGATVSTGAGGVVAVPLVAKGRGEADGSTVDCAYFLGIDSGNRLVADFEAYPADGIVAGQNFPAQGTAILPLNEWTHVAASYDGAAADGQKWKLYVNGARDTNALPDPPPGALPRYDSIQHFAIGSALNSTGAASGFFQGIIDEVRVWNVARGDAQVLAGISREVLSGAGLLARFGFGDGAGNMAANSVENSPSGTLAGPPAWVQGREFGSNTPPTVSITSPADGFSAVAPVTVLIAAAASDSDGTIARVEFFAGGTKIGEDTAAPFELAWERSTAQTGTFAVTAMATDNAGATAVSAPVSIVIAPNPNQPPSITPTSPAENATGSQTSATLSVNLSDPENGPLSVKFHGRVAPPPPGPDFTLIAIPDTQYYSAGHPSWAQTVTVEQLVGMFGLQTQWIVEQRMARRIAFVSHMGDLVDNFDWNIIEWQRASAAMSKVENPATTFLGHGIPWGVAPGNHDIAANGQTVYYNQFFGPGRWEGRPYYGGHYGALNTNNYELFSASGLDFVILHLKYDPAADPAVLDWADSVLRAYPNRRAIVTSHYIINYGNPFWGNPATFSPQGQAIYDRLKSNPNLFLMLCGHVHGEGLRSDVFEGRTIHTVLQDYQFATNGGNGFLRIFTFSPADNTIRVESWSPFLNRALIPSDHIPQFNGAPITLSYNMQGAIGGWIELGSVNVPAGSGSASFEFTGLDPGRNYEWYATVADGINVASSEPRRFSTAGNSPPIVALTSPALGTPLTAGSPVTIAAAAGDSDGSIARVEFFDGATRLGQATLPPYQIAWTPAAGVHALTAVATDDLGADSVSPVVNASVSILGNVRPVVAITLPADGLTVAASRPLAIEAAASDADGSVTRVEFFDGATRLGEATAAPFRFTWQNVPEGPHVLFAIATDNGFGTTVSAPVQIAAVTAAGALPYGESFDSMGATGIAPPPCWSMKIVPGGGAATWTDATGISPGLVGAMTHAGGPPVATEAPSGTNNNGFNAAAPGDPNDRALATSPGSVAGVALELALVNGGASPIGVLRIGYDIRRFTVADSPNELAGYRLFCSVDGGVSWAAVNELNPGAGASFVQVPNAAGVTTVPPTTVTLPSPWAAGSLLLLRWVDDDAVQSSPDQIIGLDNVFIDRPAGEVPVVAITSPANGSSYFIGGPVGIAAAASDLGGTIEKVEFFVDGAKVGERTSPPYGLAWPPTGAGSHVIAARAIDNDGNAAWSAPVTVSYPVPPFTLWRMARFGAQLSNPAMAGDLACPAGDGVSNLCKYALGLDPYSPAISGLPELSVESGAIRLLYTKLKAATDVGYQVLWSNDLVQWSEDGISEEIVPGSETPTAMKMRARIPATPGGRIFACLRVTRLGTGTNAALTSLQPGAGALSQAFDPGVTSYVVNLASEVMSFSLTTSALDPFATIVTTGGPNLVVGANMFTVRVTAEDGVTSRTYHLVVNRAAPSDLPPLAGSLVLRLETAQGVAAAGVNVTAWNDLSGRQNNLVAGGTPRLGAVQTPAGRPAITLNGSGDKIERLGGFSGLPTGNADRTMFVVAKYNNSTAWAGVAYGTGAPNQAFGLYIKHPTGELGLHGWGQGNDLISNTPGIGAGWLVQSGVLSAGNAILFKDGIQIGQFAHTFNTVVSKLVIGQEMANLGYVGMDVAAVLLYDRALSPAERASVETYLRTKYLVPAGP